MPETLVRIAWPNGQEDTVYSPSSTIVEYLKPGVELSLSEFEAQALRGLDFASRRVTAIYGFACTAAEAEKERLVAAVRQHQAGAPAPTDTVKILTVKARA
ncbi:MSMEG_0570 family nitrogen starvation response protein [Hymenobacter caeli]|uniref:Repeat protein (TIGR04042 family) n=1 Tax=Hymenobacter caeli TaxID=2735894 RepID=A0ABX2FME6_9BACT|nr:MSMEG_0570 family nitrogen starvation response protein [Hymenobacter caeli]NRT18191.1 putative repeat protein (TIGR04042 family) [Hymenobacter caeli]